MGKGKFGKYTVNVNDIIGVRFGNLVVVELAGELREEYDGVRGHHNKHRYLYKCKCDCGSERVVRRDPLLEGITKSCGCSRIKVRRKGVRKEEYGLYNGIKMLPKVRLELNIFA